LETPLSVAIRLEIPGINEDDLAVDIHGNILRIRGDKRPGADRVASLPSTLRSRSLEVLCGLVVGVAERFRAVAAQ
jgi:HSP20 family molecular chaperone IbpA